VASRTIPKGEKQHKTSCPSGRMIHTVVIACKQSEKLLDSIMKKHGSHVRQEEYAIAGGETKVRLILDTVARVEESLHSVPFDRYEGLLKAVNDFLIPNPDVHAVFSTRGDMEEGIATTTQTEMRQIETDITEEEKKRDVESFIEKYRRLEQDRLSR